MRRVHINLCPATINVSIITVIMWNCLNSLKNVESDNNKILYEILLDFFLQRNGTYFLNKPRTLNWKQTTHAQGPWYYPMLWTKVFIHTEFIWL